MFNGFRNIKIRTFFWSFMAFYLLNISVDTPYLFQNKQPANLTFNDQESIIEVLFEKVLGFENAIPENDDCDTEQKKAFKKGYSIDKFVVPFWEIKTKISFTNLRKNAIFQDKTIFKKPYLEIHSPPPEV
jgi:hypothetical protein